MQFDEKATKKNYSHGYNDSRKEGRSSVYKFWLEQMKQISETK